MGRRNATLAFWGQKDLALSLLKSSIVAGHYCAYDGLRNDSAFATLRGTPELTQLLSAAKQCQSDFLSERSPAAHGVALSTPRHPNPERYGECVGSVLI